MSTTGKIGGIGEKSVAYADDLGNSAPVSQTAEKDQTGFIGKGDFYVKIVSGDDIGFFLSGDMPEELDWALKNMKSADKRMRGTEVFTASFPSSFFRLSPRPGYNRGDKPFVSKGILRTYEEYKSYLAFVARTNQYYDEEYGRKKMVLKAVDPDEWQEISKAGILEKVMASDQKYANDGNPLLHHTADYSPGSSGGGIFLEKNGKLLGIVPYSSTICYPQTSYCGTGALYRIDNICSQSAVLRNLEKCKELTE